ncbi:MAG: ATP-binding protein [Bacteroidales bacterium]|nr:ATP-binding protein [Candidatus Colicola faecequi]
MGLIKKPSEIEAKKNISMMIYGQPGMGKTTLALSAPSAVLFDADNGVNRINAAHQTDTLQVSSWEQIPEALKEVVDGGYKTIAIDTLGKAVGFIEKYIVEHDLAANKGKHVWTYPNGALTLKGFGERKNIFKAFLNSVMTSGLSVILIAHEKEEKRDNNVVKRADAGSDGFAADIYKDLDLVGYIYGIGNERHITFQTNDEHFCKKTGSMQNDYTIPAIVDANGNAVGNNNFIEKVILPTYANDQERSRKMHQEYDKLVADIKSRVEAIKTVDDANAFVEFMKGAAMIYDSKVIAGNEFTSRINTLGFKFDAKQKKYVAA